MCANDKEIMEDIRKDLKSKNRSVRALGCKSLARFKNRAAAFLLVSMLSDRDPDVRFHASESLLKIEDVAVGSLIAALGHDEWIVRRQACEIIKKLARTSQEPVRALRNSLSSDDANIRFWSIKILCELKDAKIVPAIKKLFKTAKSEDKICIANAISSEEIDDEFKDLLISGLSDSVWNVRKACADALLKLGQSISSDLMKYLYVQDFDKYYWCTKLLGQLKDERAIAPLLEILETCEPEKAEFAIVALGEIGSAKATNSLLKLLNSDSWTIRKTAADALLNIGENALSELEKLYDAPDTPDDARYWCVRITGCMKSLRAAQLVSKALSDIRWFVRACACNCIAQLYETGSETILKLFELKNDKNTEVCLASQHALDSIDREKLRMESKTLLESGKCSRELTEIIEAFWLEHGERLDAAAAISETDCAAKKHSKKISYKKLRSEKNE